MKKYLLLAFAAAVVSTPAAARDGSGYVGVEAGAFMPRDSDVDRRGAVTGGIWGDWLSTVDHKMGYDLDLIGGYDFGMFRLEAELGYKHAKHKEYTVDSQAGGLLPAGVTRGATIDADGESSVLSGMVNALADFGSDDGFSFYAGAGVGLARVNMEIDQLGDSAYQHKDTDSLAWQILGGVRTPISDNIDAGLKYRYFQANTKGDVKGHAFDARTSLKSHSLLASLIYNFGAAAAPPPPPPRPPPPPPPPPATQTCPDGSVILATEACPVPPPPPPPPPPAPERG